MAQIIKRILGGIQTAIGYPDVPKDGFVDGFDIVDQSPMNINEDGYNQPAPNNEYAYDIGVVEQINKKYRIKIDLVVANAYNIELFLSLPGSWSYQTIVAHGVGDDGAATLTTIQAAILGNPYLTNTAFTNISTSAASLSFNIEFLDFPFLDFYLTCIPAQGSATCVAINDAISGEKEGNLIPISFCNANYRQQVFSTTCNNEPERYDFINVVAGEVVGGGADFIRDEEVYIFQTVSSIQGAYYTLEYIGPGNYKIIGAVDPAGTLVLPDNTYSVIRYKRSLGVIGQASKILTPASNNWEYIEWIRSINLNFRTYKQIQSEGKLTDNGLILDWTDWLNPMKRMYYFGNENINGFLTHYNPDGIYDLDTVKDESILQLRPNTSKVKIEVATQDFLTKTRLIQGAKPEASYVAFVRFITQDGAVSTFSPPSNVTWTHSSNLLTHAYGEATNMSLRISVEQIEQDIYDKLEIGIVEFGTDTFKGYLLPQISINGVDSITVIDTGLDVTQYSLWDPSTEVEQIAFYFENVRRIKDFDGYKIGGNVNLPPVYDLTTWAEGLAAGLTITTRTISIQSDFAITQQARWLDSGYNSFGFMSNEWASYMPNDKVRIGVRVWWENGAPPTDFWIGDFEITDSANNPITNNANPVLINQYHFEVTGINLSSIVGDNGESIFDVVKDFRFTRTLINPQVVAQGIGLILAGGATPYTVGNSYRTLVPDATPQPAYCAFYSPDLLNTGQSIVFEAGDEVRGLEATVQNGLTLFTNWKAMDFFGNSASAAVVANVVATESLSDGGTGQIAILSKTTANPSTVTNRGGVILQLSVSLTYTADDGVNNIYYLRPYTGGIAYPNDPKKDLFFVMPQDIWFNKATHTTSTVYKVFGGDCFGQKSYYKIGIDDFATSGLKFNDIVGFYSYNRGNYQLRSGLNTSGGNFPHAGLNTVIGSSIFDTYTYDNCFTPRYPFQNYPAFDANLRTFNEQISSLYYSQKAITQGYAGGNRLWLPLDTKALEIQYGGITGIEVLLGFSQNGMLLVWQEKRLTAQFFDNTANIKSNTGELLIGNGKILERKGVDYTNYGCSHPWTIKVGKNLAGHDTVYWYCNTNKTFMRLGADGTTNIGLSLAGILNKYAILADYQDYDFVNIEDNPYLPDTPAKDYGIHAVWNDLSKEYICSIRLMRRAFEYDPILDYKSGSWVMDSSEKWGFEQLPTLYKSLINDNAQPLTDNAAWAKYDYYNFESMLFLTVVWNENTNSWKSYRTFNPKIYGGFENSYVSSHPVQPNYIFEHNNIKNEALYYCVKIETFLPATTDPANFKILCTGIGAVITGFNTLERQKYVISINGKNYQITGVNTDDLDMANVDADDVLPVATIAELTYYVCNSQDPYIEPIVNGFTPRFFQFDAITTQIDSPLKRVEHYAGLLGSTQTSTQSFNNYSEFRYSGGGAWCPIKMDTTNSPNNNDNSRQHVQGNWMKEKLIWRWGKKNKLHNFVITAMEQQKTI